MDSRYILLFYCLSYLGGSAYGCEELVEDVLTFRDGFVRYFNLCNEFMYGGALEALEGFLGFPVSSDERLTSLLCDVAEAEDIEELARVVNEHIAAPLTEESIIDSLTEMRYDLDVIPGIVDGVEKIQRKLQPWLVKSNFPHTWPVPNTAKKETARMMAKGDGTFTMNLVTYDSVPDAANYKQFAKALLRADSLDEYLSAIGFDYSRSLECYTAMQDLYRDTAAFQALAGAPRALVRALGHLDELGIFDFIPN